VVAGACLGRGGRGGCLFWDVGQTHRRRNPADPHGVTDSRAVHRVTAYYSRRTTKPRRRSGYAKEAVESRSGANPVDGGLAGCERRGWGTSTSWLETYGPGSSTKEEGRRPLETRVQQLLGTAALEAERVRVHLSAQP
jgi:hypothetical protein